MWHNRCSSFYCRSSILLKRGFVEMCHIGRHFLLSEFKFGEERVLRYLSQWVLLLLVLEFNFGEKIIFRDAL